LNGTKVTRITTNLKIRRVVSVVEYTFFLNFKSDLYTNNSKDNILLTAIRPRGLEFKRQVLISKSIPVIKGELIGHFFCARPFCVVNEFFLYYFTRLFFPRFISCSYEQSF